MRFTTKTNAQKIAEDNARLEAQLAEAKTWRLVFAWLPCSGDGDWVWLEHVEVSHKNARIENGRWSLNKLTGRVVLYGAQFWRYPEEGETMKTRMNLK